MIWYGVEPLVAGDLELRGRVGATRVQLPQLLQLPGPSRRGRPSAAKGLAALGPVLKLYRDDLRGDVLDGVLDALRGRKQVPRPEGWAEIYAGVGDQETRASSKKRCRWP